LHDQTERTTKRLIVSQRLFDARRLLLAESIIEVGVQLLARYRTHHPSSNQIQNGTVLF
jgi:hypothetical protein